MEQQTQRRLALAAAASPTHSKGEEEMKGPPSATPSPVSSPLPLPAASSAAALLATLDSLRSLLRTLPRLPLLFSLNYILFPLTSFLSQPMTLEKSSEAALLSALSSLAFLLRATSEDADCTAAAAAVIGDEQGFAGLCTLLIQRTRDAGSEEVKAAAIDCLAALLTSATSHLSWWPQSPLRLYVHSSPFHISLGYLISLLIPCLASTSRALQRSALLAVSAACGLLSPSPAGVSMLTSYLPGVLSALQKLLVRDDKAGTQVKGEAIRLMTDLLVAVLSGEEVERLAAATSDRHQQPPPTIEEVQEDADEESTRAQAEVQSKLSHLHFLVASRVAPSSTAPSPAKSTTDEEGSAAAGPSADLLISRDVSWYGETRERVLLIMQLIFAQSPLYPRSAALECEYVRSARRLLGECGRVLRDCVVVWVEYVLAMTQHNHDDVRHEAATVLSTFTAALSSLPDTAASDALIASLSSRLHHHLRSLPRLLQSSTQATQLRLLHTASGYMELLGSIPSPSTPGQSPLFTLLSSPSAFPHLFIQLLPALRLSPDTSIIVERSDDDSDPVHLLHSLHDQPAFLHAPDDSVRLALLHLLRGIGQCTGEQVGQLLDALLSFLPGEGGGRGDGHVDEWLVLIHQVIVGLTLSPTAAQASAPYLLLALETFIQPELFSSSQSPAVLALLLSAVATIAWQMRGDFQPYLMHVLFPLLSHIGSPSLHVSSAAMSCLRVIAAALGYESGQALVLGNVDYVVDAIAAHLLSAQPTPQLLAVMRAVLSRLPPSPQLIPLLHDTLDSLVRLLSLSTGGEEERIVSIEVLQGVVVAVRRYYDASPPPTHPSTRSGLFASTAPLSSPHLLLPDAAPHYHPSRVIERLQLKRDQHRREDADAAQLDATTATAPRLTPNQWYAQQEAKRERREERKSQGLRDSDSDSDDDEEARTAKAEHRQWREREREDEAVRPTPEQAVVLQLMQQARSWVGRGGVREQVLVLELIREAIVVLYTIPKELFPLIAQLWPPVLALIRRYQRAGGEGRTTALTVSRPADGGSGEASMPPVSVLIAALELVAVLCHYASRFLATRFQSELWPVLSAVLGAYQHQMKGIVQLTGAGQALSPRAAAAQGAPAAAAGLHLTAPHRLLVSALSSLAFLLRYPDLMRQHALEVVKACRPYLDEAMPEQVNEQAAAVFRAAYALNAEAVEWALGSIVEDEDEEAESGEEKEGAGEVELTQWEKVDEWGLDRRGELRLLWQRVKDERRKAHDRAHQQASHHQVVSELLAELRALPVPPPVDDK